jgi:hypothetical protein
VIEFHASRAAADRELQILHDEPDWSGKFEIVVVNLGGLEPTVATPG